MGRKGNPYARPIKMQTGAATVESEQSSLKILNVELPYDPVFPLLGIYTEKLEHQFQRIMHPCVHCSIIYNSQDVEATYVFIHR